MEKNNKMIISAVLGAIVIAGVSFWGGMSYAGGGAAVRGPGAGQFAGRAGGSFRASGNGAVFGSVLSIAANSMTVQLGRGPGAAAANGTDTGSKIILIGTNTEVGKFVSGSIADLKPGESVLINGTPNSDGSLTATNIQIRPANAPGFGPRAASSTSGQ